MVYHFSTEAIRKGYLFCEKSFYKKGKGLDLGAEPPHTYIHVFY